MARDAKKSWPLFRSLASWRAADLPGDLIAGLTLAAIAIPEQMATARLGGFEPQIGFFAFIAGSVGFAMLGGNRFLSCGADSTITPIFAGGLAALAATGSADYQAFAIALALIVGIMLVASGLFKLGGVANLLSVPVTVGFLLGISVHIMVSQLPGVLGLPSPSGSTLDRIGVIARELGQSNPVTILIGFGVLAAVFVSEMISAKIPGALIGLVAATLAVIGAGLESKGVKVVGTVPATLPMPTLPDLAPDRWLRLVPLAFVIAIVVMVQTAATTRSFLSDPEKPADVDRDFLGAGAGSVLAGIFGAFPVNASPPRTGIVAETGGHSQLSGLAAAAIVLALLAFGTGLLKHVPDAALGGILLVRRATHHPHQADRADLSAVDLGVRADPGDGGLHHRAADPAGRGARHHPVAGARHLEHDAGAADDLRARTRHHHLVARLAASAFEGRAAARHRRGRPAGAAVVSQRARFPGRCDKGRQRDEAEASGD